MTPQQIMDGMVEKNRLLYAKNDEYINLVEGRAQKERIYNMAVSKETIDLKLEGHAISLIEKMVAGSPVVSKMKMEFEVAKGVERACLSSIKILTSQIDTYRSLLSWLKAELQSQ